MPGPTMRAAVMTGPGSIAIREVPVPVPGPGEVRVRLEGSGVCASNLATWQGAPWFDYPLPPGAPGHEGWGVVDEVGHDVQLLREGDRVTGLSGHAFAEFDLASEPELVRLPDALSSQPFPGEPVGCAFNILGRSRIDPDHTVAIIGMGFLGTLVTRLAARTGARVIALSRDAGALDRARSCGAAETILMDDHSRIIDQIRDLTDGSLCDRVIECTGEQLPLDLGGELTRTRGTLVIAGYHQDGPRRVNLQLWNWRGIDVVNAHERDPAVHRRGIEAAVAAAEEGWLDLDPLLTHTYPLDHLAEALDATLTRESGFVKAVVTP